MNIIRPSTMLFVFDCLVSNPLYDFYLGLLAMLVEHVSIFLIFICNNIAIILKVDFINCY
jgi:hypothetical protein